MRAYEVALDESHCGEKHRVLSLTDWSCQMPATETSTYQIQQEFCIMLQIIDTHTCYYTCTLSAYRICTEKSVKMYVAKYFSDENALKKVTFIA